MLVIVLESFQKVKVKNITVLKILIPSTKHFEVFLLSWPFKIFLKINKTPAAISHKFSFSFVSRIEEESYFFNAWSPSTKEFA